MPTFRVAAGLAVVVAALEGSPASAEPRPVSPRSSLTASVEITGQRCVSDTAAMSDVVVTVVSSSARSAVTMLALYVDGALAASARFAPREFTRDGGARTASAHFEVPLGEGPHQVTACVHHPGAASRRSGVACSPPVEVVVSCQSKDPCKGGGLPPNPLANGGFESDLTGWVTDACASQVRDDDVHCAALNLTACFYQSRAWQVAPIDVDQAASLRLRLDVKLMTFYGSYSGPLIARVYTGGPPNYDDVLVGTHTFLPGEPSGTSALEGTTTQPIGVWASWTSDDIKPLLPAGSQHVRVELRDAAGWGSWEGAGRFDNVRLVSDDDAPPVASASASPSSGRPPLEVQLTGQCADPDGDCGASWWDFGTGPTDNGQQGGGETSLLASTAHVYDRQADYWVSFTAQDDRGAASTSLTKVRVFNATPTVSIVATAPSGPAPHVSGFAAVIVDDDDTHAYAWDFGDGGSSSEASPTHQFQTAGTYLVTVTVTDPLGASSAASFAVVAIGDRPIGNGDFSAGLSGWVTEACASPNQDDAVHGTALNLTACFYRSHAWQVAAVDVDAQGGLRLRLDVKLMTFNGWYSGPMVAKVYAGVPPSYDQTLVGTHVFAPGDLSESDALAGTTHLPMAVWYAWTSEDLGPLLPAGTQFVRVELWDVLGGWEGGGRFDNVKLIRGDVSIPVASASADPASGHPPLDVQFHGACQDADGDCAAQWWDFGNGPIANGSSGGGDTSTMVSPTYTFTGEDTHVISYTVEDLEGAASTTFVTVSVLNEAPSVSIVAAPPVGPAPLVSTFEAIIVDDDDTHTYLWSFGDGSSSSEARPSHVFQAAGTYDVTVTVTDPFGVTGVARFAVVATSDRPIGNGDFTAGLSGWVTEACVSPTQDDDVHGTALNLTACFYRSHAWQVAAVDVDAQDGVRLRLDVKLMTYNGSYSGPMVVKVYTGVAPSYDQTLVGTHRFVPGSFTQSGALDGTTSLPMSVWYAWTSEDLAPLLPPGTRFVRVELWDAVDGWEGGGRFDNVGLVLGSAPTPVASIVAQPTFGPAPLEVALSGSCSGDCAAQWWDFGDGPTANGTAGGGSTSIASDVVWTFTGDRSYTVTFTVEDTLGAASTAVQTVSSVRPPPEVAIVATPGTGPAPLSVQLTANVTVAAGGSVTAYAWSFGDGGQSAQPSPSHVFSDPGTYLVTLTVTDDQGASSSASYVIIAGGP